MLEVCWKLEFLDSWAGNIAASKYVRWFCLLKRPPLVLPAATFYSLNVANAISLVLFCLGESKLAWWRQEGDCTERQGWPFRRQNPYTFLLAALFLDPKSKKNQVSSNNPTQLTSHKPNLSGWWTPPLIFFFIIILVKKINSKIFLSSYIKMSNIKMVCFIPSLQYFVTFYGQEFCK